MNPELSSEKYLPNSLAGRLASIGLSPKKAVEHLALFVVLTGIYYFYFVRDARENACPTDDPISFAQLGVLILKFLCFTSWPFAVVAFWDAEWSSKDAGHVFLASYLFTNVLWYHKTHCAFCIFAASFRIVPYCFCALVAHAVGAWRHRNRKEI